MNAEITLHRSPDAEVARIALSAQVSRAWASASASCEREPSASVPAVLTSRGGLQASLSKRLMFAGIGLYVQVSPDVVWLTEDNGFSGDFVVESNTDWTIQKEE